MTRKTTNRLLSSPSFPASNSSEHLSRSYLCDLQGLLLLLASLQPEPPGRPSSHGNADKISSAHFLPSAGQHQELGKDRRGRGAVEDAP